jgi:oxygen-independent coproporphyrinogen-3 oxidase
MRIQNEGLLRFDYQLPIYNWFYPLRQRMVEDTVLSEPQEVFNLLDNSKVSRRALYFHIPFCDTICTFCPLVRSRYHGDAIVEDYTRALIREIELKSRFKPLGEVPVDTIFFGGGTPSILSPDQILRIGKAIRKCYDVRGPREWTFEMEVKSITRDKLAAMREVGTTHARFGLQTFNPLYRKLFNLTATLDQIDEAVGLLKECMPYISFDVLYGMNGQTVEDFVGDVQQSMALGTPTIDFYPINNYVTQRRLHLDYEEHGLEPTSVLTKLSMNIILNELMRAGGYVPHNGHGFAKVPPEEVARRPVVTDLYSYGYHEYVYGYRDEEVIGFGTGGMSSMNRFTTKNMESRDGYIRSLLEKDTWEMDVYEHSPRSDASRGVIVHLPYHGSLDKSRIDWDQVYPDTLRALSELVEADLIKDVGDRYKITQLGWYWYVNLMYYLHPEEDRDLLDRFMAGQRAQPGRKVEQSVIEIGGSRRRPAPERAAALA